MKRRRRTPRGLFCKWGHLLAGKNCSFKFGRDGYVRRHCKTCAKIYMAMARSASHRKEQG